MTHLAYQLVFCEANTGILLNEDGSRHQTTQPAFQPTFATLEEVKDLGNELLKKHAFSEFWIKKTGEENLEGPYHNPHLDEYLQEEKKYMTWKVQPFFCRIFKKKPITKYFKDI